MVAKHWRLKPSVVKAELLTEESAEEIAAWCGGTLAYRLDSLNPGVSYPVLTFRGVHGFTTVHLGYYVVELEDGQFDRRTKREFEHSYERVADDKPQEETLFVPGGNIFDLPRTPFEG